MKNGLLLIVSLLAVTSVIAQSKKTPTPQWRPIYHFTPDKYWTNDPNGLIYLNGKFQLYYQHNPFENKWGHMSWGHAESADLVHWTHLPVAIPEVVTKDTTTYIYSGSAVLDKNNTSGFGLNGQAPVVAVFTADQPKQKKESQFIAYSNDEGMTYKLYDQNPVIDLNESDFRDPNVFWFAPTKEWIMTVSIVNEHMIRFYGSKNLKDWSRLSDFGPAGNTINGWECPSLVPLEVDGNHSNVKYVLFVSLFGDHGPEMQYFVGDFDGTTFKNMNPQDQTFRVDYGDCFYAAIPWRDIPQNKKILLGWMINGKQETYPWKGQMSIPRDLSLKTTSEGIKLVQTPTSVVRNSITKYAKGTALIKKNMLVTGKMKISSPGKFDQNSYWLEATLQPGKTGRTEFWVAASKEGVNKVRVGYNAAKQALYIDCSSTEAAKKDSRNLLQIAPLKAIEGKIKITILMDRSSLEVFGNDGECVLSTMIYPTDDNWSLWLSSTSNSFLKTLKVWDMYHK